MIMEAFAAQAALAKSALRLHLSASLISGVTLLIGGIFALFALGFAAIAIFLVLEEHMSAPTAALWVAFGALVLALLIWLVGSLMARTRRRAARIATTGAMAPLTAAGLAAAPPPPPPRSPGAAPPPPPNTHAMMLDHGMAIGAQAQAAMAAHPVRLLAVGLGMGVAVGFSPTLRRGIRRLLPW